MTTTIPATAASRATTGRIVQISISAGGVPKLAVARAMAGTLGLEGDGHHHPKLHGGPERALCLFSLEVIERLQAEGHPITPGSTGENLTIAGLDFGELQSGDRLQIGDTVLIELTRHTTPCKTIAASFRDGDPTRILQTTHPGESRIYARVLTGGLITTGDPVCFTRDA